MKIEHVAFNVPDPLAMGRWYVEHLGFTVKRRVMEAPWAHFLADDSGTMMLEIYGNTDKPIPDYQAQDPMVLHLAFISDDVAADAERLKQAGATQVGDIQRQANGDCLAMLRDPWGFAVQLVMRGEAML